MSFEKQINGLKPRAKCRPIAKSKITPITATAKENLNLLIPILNQNLPPKRRIKPSIALFRKISKLEEEYSKTEVTKVIRWFAAHCKDKYTPKVFGVHPFYDRFPEIQYAMQRWKQDNPTFKVKRKFKVMALERFGVTPSVPSMLEYWTPTFVKLFPYALQLTHDNFSQFSDWIWNHEEYKDLYGPYVPHPGEFTFEWFKRLENWFETPSHRKINPLSLIFDLSNEKSNKWIRWWANEHSFAPGTAKRLIKEFKNQQRTKNITTK